MSKEIFIYGLDYILHASPAPHFTPHQMVTKCTLHILLIMVPFVFLVVPPLQNEEGLDNHLGSCPGCLDELGISCASNWAATLKLPSITTSSKAINHHLFNAKLATSHLAS
jgi:hypothetical protein